MIILVSLIFLEYKSLEDRDFQNHGKEFWDYIFCPAHFPDEETKTQRG